MKMEDIKILREREKLMRSIKENARQTASFIEDVLANTEEIANKNREIRDILKEQILSTPKFFNIYCQKCAKKTLHIDQRNGKGFCTECGLLVEIVEH